MGKYHKDHVFIIGDLHLPFIHKDYLDFCLEIKERCKCGTVVFAGDIADLHSISYHEVDPNGKSPADEMKEVDRHLEMWKKAFPVARICRGNHDRLVDRKGRTAGLPERVFRQFRDIWQFPNTWVDDFEFQIDNVRYIHGTAWGGKFPHINAAYDSRQSVVIGHCHSVCGVDYLANSRDCVFGMSVGCGIDRKSYAMAYGVDFRRKPILGCGVVTDNGRFAQVFPLPL